MEQPISSYIAGAVAGEGLQHPEHTVQFYDRDEELCAAVAEYLAAGLAAGQPVLAIATEAHAASIAFELEARGFDLEGAQETGQLTILDADATLARFMVGSQPDRELFEQILGRELERIDTGAGTIIAYGEMVDVLWRAGNTVAALRLEEMWNDLQRGHSFALLCAYAMTGFYRESAGIRRVCALHGRVVPAGAAPTDDYARILATEIARRKDIEGSLRASLREVLRADADVRRSQEELKDFVDNAAVGIHQVGPDGTILWANRAELELLGYTEDQYVGLNIRHVHADLAVVDDILARLHGGQVLHDQEARLVARDGSIRHVLITSSALLRDGELVHTRCFTRDITERKRAEEALRDNERRLQLITDALPVLVAYVDAGEHYQFANVSYERWFSLDRHEMVGRHLADVLGSDAYQSIRPHVQLALSGETVSFQAEVRYRHGGMRWVEATYVPHFSSSGVVQGFVALVADINQRKHLEESRASTARWNERFMKITAAIAEAVTTSQVYDAVVDEVARVIGASSAGLFMVREDGASVELVRSLGYTDEGRAALARVDIDAEPRVPALDVIAEGKPLWLASQDELLARYPHLAHAVTPGRSYRIACLPLRAPGQTIGALGLTFDDAPPLDEDDRSFLLLVARYAGQALLRLRVLEAEQQSRARAEAAAARWAVLARTAAAVSTAGPELGALLQSIVENVTVAYADACGLMLIAEDGETLNIAAIHHVDPDLNALIHATANDVHVKVGEGVAGGVARSGEPVVLPWVDVAALLEHAHPSHRQWIEKSPPSSLVCVPLRARGKILGTLGVGRRESTAPFGAEDQRLLEEVAERAALAIESNRLRQETEWARMRAELLYRLARGVIDADAIEDVYKVALDALEEALGAKRASILVYDAEDVMRFVAWRQLSDEYRAAVEGHSPWPRNVRRPEPLLVPDVAADPAMAFYLPILLREGIGALGFIPLVAAGKLLGKLMVYYDAPHDFSAQELAMARAIANHMAAAISRFDAVAELHETVRFNEVFTGILGHDLRNPLGAIMTSAQLAIRREDSERLIKPLSRILSSGDRMARMIDQLLDFTRVRVGSGIQLDPRPTELSALIRTVMDELDDANPSWTLSLGKVGDTDGEWDPDRLAQVFSNLVANAVQHGIPEHGVKVFIDGTATDVIRVDVHNMGAVPQDLLPKLFDPMGGGRHRDRSSGLGLGLFITREIVRAHAGDITVRSSEDAGTNVSVTLPRIALRSEPHD